MNPYCTAGKKKIVCENSIPNSVVERCVSSAKGCGFDSQGTHILMKMYNLNAIVSALDKSVC